MGKARRGIILSSEEIKEKYLDLNWSPSECAKYFNISIAKLYDYITEYGLKKSKELSDLCKKRTCMLKYGADSIFRSNHYKEKSKLTCLEKYGTEYANQAPEIRKKIYDTNIALYGGMFGDSPIRQKKAKQTCLSKYGNTNYNNIDKARQTCLEKYGVDWFAKTEDYIIKSKDTYIKNYGVDSPAKCHEIQLKQKKKYFYNNLSFDSGIELEFYIYLTDFKIPFIYHPDIYYVYYFNDKEHWYFPDFYINGTYFDIKGGHFIENGKMINPYDRSQDGLYEAKHQCMLSNNITIIEDKELSFVKDYIRNTYGKDYIKMFKEKNERGGGAIYESAIV